MSTVYPASIDDIMKMLELLRLSDVNPAQYDLLNLLSTAVVAVETQVGPTGTDVTLAGTNAFTGVNTFTNAAGIVTRVAATQDGIKLVGRAGGSSSYLTSIVSGILGASIILTLPTGSGTLARLSDITGGTPGGADTQVQFNDSSSFGGDAGMTYNKTTDALTIAGSIINAVGSAAAPSYTFTGVTNAGMYNIGTGLGLSAGGVLQLFLSTSIAQFAGQITVASGGVGTAKIVGNGSTTGISFTSSTGVGLVVAGSSILDATATTLTASVIGIFPATTTAAASIRLPHGIAPTSPTDGDVWTTTAAGFIRISGVTVQLATTASLAAYLPLAGGTMTGKLNTVASATGGAGLNIPSGVAPTSPVDGDMWVDSISGNHLAIRISSGTRYLASFVAASAPLANQVIYSAGGVGGVVTGDNNFLWNGTQMFVTGQIGLNIAASASTQLNIAASTTAVSPLRLATGVAPTSPVNGDIWYDGANIFIRVGGTTKTFTII